MLSSAAIINCALKLGFLFIHLMVRILNQLLVAQFLKILDGSIAWMQGRNEPIYIIMGKNFGTCLGDKGVILTLIGIYKRMLCPPGFPKCQGSTA
jgi:hypothetical protein